MESQINTVENAVLLLREHMETIRINLDILEVLQSNGRIRDTDKQYAEIMELNRKNQQAFNKFVFTELPWFLEADQKPGNQAIKKTFFDWATSLQVNLSHLDRTLKEYLHGILLIDQSLISRYKDQEVKDKRFWSYLEKAKSRTRLFLSFEDPDHPDASDQAMNPEKGIEQQQREKE